MNRGVPTPAAAAVRRLPSVSLLLAACAIAAHLVPGTAQWLQLDRAAIASGQLWRMVTCHLAHFSGDHLFWDVLVFVILGLICERLDRRRLVMPLAWSAAAISTVVLLLEPSIEVYRGLSGID